MKTRLLISILFVAVACAKAPVIQGNRAPSKPFISGDGFRAMADQVFDETDQSLRPDEVALGDIVFVKSDKLDHFFAHIHPHIQSRYILISHNSDPGAPEAFESYLEDEKIFRWFGQNPSIKHHDKFVAIPIGIANQYVRPHGNHNHFIPFWDKQQTKDCLLGYNFHAGTHAERGPVLKHFAAQAYVQNLHSADHREYLSKMSKAKCILSPRGNGLDCHRTWEALIVGTIPILRSSPLDELLEGLPVLIVDDWLDVDEQLLEQQYEQLHISFSAESLEKVTFSYWQRVLHNCQQAARAG